MYFLVRKRWESISIIEKDKIVKRHKIILVLKSSFNGEDHKSHKR